MARSIEHNDPVEAAKAVIRRHEHYYGGPINIGDGTLREIANAVLASSDAICSAHELCIREQWAHDARYREYVRARLRRRLLDEITSEGRVPTALPTEELRHVDLRYTPMSVVTGEASPDSAVIPAEAVEQGADWTHVEVVLSVPVRTPPVDRKAAVKAGLLHG